MSALGAVHTTESQIGMLRAHYHAPDRTITQSQLADAVGFKNFQAANLWYGRLGHAIADRTGFVPGKGETYSDGRPIWTCVLATYTSFRGTWGWKMRQELADALERLGWLSDAR